MLTATGLVNGEWQILTPYRIETLEPIDKNNLVHVITSGRRTPNLVQISPINSTKNNILGSKGGVARVT